MLVKELKGYLSISHSVEDDCRVLAIFCQHRGFQRALFLHAVWAGKCATWKEAARQGRKEAEEGAAATGRSSTTSCRPA